jgi:dolichyl-phosphate beta-glucosyltransferase
VVSRDLSIVLPCYNEGPTLRESLDRIVGVCRAMEADAELILIDDHSTDDTPREVARFAAEAPLPVTTIFHEANRGRGATVREGLAVAEGRVVGFLDVDLEVGPEYIPAFRDAIVAGADVATGRRYLRVGLRDVHRYVASRAYVGLVRWRLRLPFADTEAGYKFFSADAAQALAASTWEDGWFWDTEVLAVAWAKGLRVVEIPCRYVRRRDKASTVRLLPDTLEYLRAMRRFRER